MEEWNVVPGFDDYEASDLGNFKRITPGKGTYINKPRKTYVNSVTGYSSVTFSNRGEKKTRTYAAHRIIAQMYIPNPFDLPMVNHINAIRTDNRACNLEWVTPKDNAVGIKFLYINLETKEEITFQSVSDAIKVLPFSGYMIAKYLNGERFHPLHIFKIISDKS